MVGESSSVRKLRLEQDLHDKHIIYLQTINLFIQISIGLKYIDRKMIEYQQEKIKGKFKTFLASPQSTPYK